MRSEFDITDITLVPSSGGVFEVTVNDRLLFSKRQTGRFPNAGEIEGMLAELAGS
ncbi:hypothetical protein DCCM_3969 [Desulfocucumis palustris]|uniref:SelT/SelW/SelH family protein n=2 Tax=Desulfocucumis palustris TaxID=1898651 RepID=A0A2L2XER0_9FIRM|nr:hypothetical protein DCCM_3969 [Desulfocucumis palustris]